MTRLPAPAAIPKRANDLATRLRETPPGEALTALCQQTCWFGEKAALTLLRVGSPDDTLAYLAAGDALRAAGETLDGNLMPPTHWDATPLTSVHPLPGAAAGESALAELAEELLGALALLCDHGTSPDKVACIARATLFAADAAISLSRQHSNADDLR